MNPVHYFEDLSAELKAVQNRIRNLIGHNGRTHWPSDGMWKESVIKSLLRRYLPESFSVGSGFIVTGDGVSSQIDVLVCDDSAPILFRDGDFIIATADCVRAVVEVKTSLQGQGIDKAIKKLSTISSLLRDRCVHPHPFLGLIAFEPTATDYNTVLGFLKKHQGDNSNYEIRALCFGSNQFYRFWEFDPRGDVRRAYDAWHAYDLDNLAPGYFVHNLVEFLFPHAVERAEHLWYPVDGKERRLLGTMNRRNDS